MAEDRAAAGAAGDRGDTRDAAAGATFDRSSLQQVLGGIEGWLYPDEAWELHRRAGAVAARARSENRRPVLVEIGSWKGRSTVCEALALANSGGGVLHAIDPHLDGEVEDTWGQLLANLSRTGTAPYVNPVRSTSHEARADFDQPVDMLFVDGSHGRAEVRQDIDDWVPLVRSGGVVAFNDPSHPGVHAALRDRVLLRGTPLRRPKLVDNTLFFELDREAAWDGQAAADLRRLRVALSLREKLAPLRRRMSEDTARRGRRALGRLVGR